MSMTPVVMQCSLSFSIAFLILRALLVCCTITCLYTGMCAHACILYGSSTTEVNLACHRGCVGDNQAMQSHTVCVCVGGPVTVVMMNDGCYHYIHLLLPPETDAASNGKWHYMDVYTCIHTQTPNTCRSGVDRSTHSAANNMQKLTRFIKTLLFIIKLFHVKYRHNAAVKLWGKICNSSVQLPWRSYDFLIVNDTTWIVNTKTRK